MKKKLRVLLITICVLICLNLLVGCEWITNFWVNGRKHLFSYMGDIESECKDYSVVDEKPAGYECLYVGNDEIVVQNKNVTIEEITQWKIYTVKIEETIIELDVDYLIANSEAFNKIIKVWDDYVWDDLEAGYYKVDVNDINISCRIFDDQFFVVVYYLVPNNNLIIDWRGCIPDCYFRFDVTDYSLEYVGYSKKYRGRSYLVKNT